MYKDKIEIAKRKLRKFYQKNGDPFLSWMELLKKGFALRNPPFPPGPVTDEEALLLEYANATLDQRQYESLPKS